MHCRFAKGLLSYIPPVELHVLRHGQTPTRRFEHKNWLTVDWKCKHSTQTKALLKSITYHADPLDPLN